LPGPPIFGGQRRIHGLITHLASSNEVSVLSLVDASVDQNEGIRDAKSYCQEVVTVSDAYHRVAGARKRLAQVRSLASTRSFERRLFHRRVVQRALDLHLASHEYDIVNCEFVFMASYRFRRPGRERPCLVLDEHNVEYDVLRRTASATTFDRRLFNALNWRKLRHEEIAAWRRFDGCTVTSRRDEELVRQDVPNVPTAVIPNGVDVDVFRPRPEGEVDPLTVLFFGAINYFPNTDGVTYFLERILPLLRARYPKVRIRIVGPGTPDSIRAQQSSNVEVAGFVDDLPSEIARAAVVIAPLRIGGGTRLKILEAMAMGRPIVSTSLGAEGLDVTHDKDILLSDTPEDFARDVGRILDDRGLGTRLGQAARRLAEERYGWKAAARKLESFYEELITSGGARSGPHARGRGSLGSVFRTMIG
jgi:glycosyltransferase involved in cell wall biosynthesis